MKNEYLRFFPGIITALFTVYSLYVYNNIPNQEISVWYNINLCPLSKQEDKQIFIGIDLPVSSACPAHLSEKDLTIAFDVPRTFFTVGAEYSAVIFRKNNASLTINMELWDEQYPLFQTEEISLIDIDPEDTTENLTSSEISVQDSTSETPNVMDDEDEGVGRTLLKGSGGSYRWGSRDVYRKRYGIASRYPKIPPIKTSYGYSGKTAVTVGTYANIFHRGPPLLDAIDCNKQEGCQHQLRHDMTRDELEITKFKLSPDRMQVITPLRLVILKVKATVIQPKITIKDFQYQDMIYSWFFDSPTKDVVEDPEVYVTFATQDEDLVGWYKVYGALALIVLFGLIQIFIIKFENSKESHKREFELYRNASRMPFPKLDNDSNSTKKQEGSGLTTLNSIRSWEEHDYGYVSFKNNQITTLDNLSLLKFLVKLDLSSNKLRSLANFGNLHTLRILDLEDNKLTNLDDFPTLASLQWLSLFSNRLSRLTGLCRKAPELLYLNIASNNLPELDLGTKNSILWIDASDNDIRKLTRIHYCSKLTHIDLSTNDLSDPSSLSSCPSLQYINLANNNLNSTYYLQGLAQLLWLRLLDLKNNDLTNADCQHIQQIFSQHDKAGVVWT